MSKRTFRIREGEPLLDVVSYGRGGPRETGGRLTPAQLEQIQRTVRRAPEVVVKVLPRASNDLAVCTGQRRGDLLALKRDQLSDQGITFRQSKTGAGVLIEWSQDLHAIVARAKAMPPQLPGEYLLRKRNGRPYTEDGFSAIWQRLMVKYAEAGGVRFSFHDLRSVSADGAATPEEARDRLGHASVETTKRHYLRGVTRAKPRS